jgi:acetyl esterase
MRKTHEKSGMVDKSSIHPDFCKVVAVELPFERSFQRKLMNISLALAAQVKRFKYRSVLKQVVVSGSAGFDIPVFVIRPCVSAADALPALLYLHGGGFILKSAPRHIDNAVQYALAANCCVIFPDYRLAPENPFPAGFNDCCDVLTWMHQNGDALGIDKTKIVVGGDSAGGALAASVVQKAVHEGGIALRGQLLVYPITDSDCKTQSSMANADIAPFKRLSMQVMWKAYLGPAVGAVAPPYASPLHGNLQRLPPAYIDIAEFDPLHDEGAAYASALTDSGVEVALNDIKGAVHGYDVVAPESDISKAAIERRVCFLKAVFSA